MRRERLFDAGSGWLIACAFIVGGVLFFAWGIGRFLFADYHCGGPECEAMEAALNRSAISAFIGLGCVVLTVLVDGREGADLAVRPGVLLAAAAGACGLAALASFAAGAAPFLGGVGIYAVFMLFPFPVVAVLLLLFPVWVIVWRSGW